MTKTAAIEAPATAAMAPPTTLVAAAPAEVARRRFACQVIASVLQGLSLCAGVMATPLRQTRWPQPLHAARRASLFRHRVTRRVPVLRRTMNRLSRTLIRAFLPFADAATPDLPLSRLLRLSLFQVSVGMALVLLVGTLNRVMIVELGVPASLVAVMVALPVLYAPFRALIGFRSDTHRSALGWRRVPFIWMGSMLQFGGLAVMPFALLVLGGGGNASQWPVWMGWPARPRLPAGRRRACTPRRPPGWRWPPTWRRWSRSPRSSA
jgi:hypothetical protein